MVEIQKANMMQIAEHCGVSLKTVSRVLNHPEQVSPKTREAVRRSMEQCGFQVNLLAKGLKQNRTNIIIVFLDKHNGDYMNLWRSRMLKYLFRYSSEIGLKIIVSPSDSHGFLEDETDGFYLLSSGIADGAILLEYMAEDQRVGYLKRTGTPYVVLGQPEEQDIPAVSLDNFDVGLKGGRYLKEKGFKKICYLTNDVGFYSTKLRVGFVFEKSCIFQQNHTAVRKKRHRLRKVNHFGNLGSFSLKAGEIHRVVLRQQCVFQLVFILMLQIAFFSVEQVGLLKILRFDIF